MAKRETFDPSAGLFSQGAFENNAAENKTLNYDETPTKSTKANLGRPSAPDLSGGQRVFKTSIYLLDDQLLKLRIFKANNASEYKDQSQIIRAALNEFFEKRNFK